jgi:hypothetical protein
MPDQSVVLDLIRERKPRFVARDVVAEFAALKPFRYSPAIALAQHKALTSRICSTLEHGVSRSRGLAKITARQRARETATFKRFRLNRNSMLRGMSSAEDVAIEIRTTAASCP